MSEHVDLLVHGGDVLTVDEAGTLVRGGAVAVREGEIVAVGPATEVGTAYTAAESIDAEGCLVLPGLVNTHTHLAMTLLRGRADDVTLQGFLERVLRWEAELLSPKNVAAAVRVAIAESLRAGVTSALDMYWFHEAAERVARRRAGGCTRGRPSWTSPTPPTAWRTGSGWRGPGGTSPTAPGGRGRARCSSPTRRTRSPPTSCSK